MDMDGPKVPLLARGDGRRSSSCSDLSCPEHSPHFEHRESRHGIMDYCCLISSSPTTEKADDRLNDIFQPETEEPLGEKGMVYGPNKWNIDLLSDEGSSFQDDQWRLRLRDKLLSYKESPFPIYYELATTATFDSALETLTRRYTDLGASKFVPNIRKILDMIQPFTATITSMVQSNPTVACLVWGSTQLVLTVGL